MWDYSEKNILLLLEMCVSVPKNAQKIVFSDSIYNLPWRWIGTLMSSFDGTHSMQESTTSFI